MVGEKNLRTYLDKFDRKYWATYKVLDILQKVSRASSPLCTPAACRRSSLCCPGRSLTSRHLAGVLPIQPCARGLR